jgi:branched-chain amino acid transport system substrate-binding protein
MRVAIGLYALVAVIAVAGLAARAEPAASPQPIVIGMVAPLTGTLSAVGTGHRIGAETAVREVNRRGGIAGRPLVLRLFDDGSNPTHGLVRMQELAADPKVVAIIGSGFGATALASAPMATRIGLPYMSMVPLHSLVYPPRPYVFTVAHTTRLVAYKLAAHLRNAGMKRIAIMRDNGSLPSEGARVVRELASRYGLEIVEEAVFPQTSTTFVAELVRVKNSRAQALWLWNTSNAVTITKEFRQLQLPQRLILIHGVATPLYLGPVCPDANGATLTAPLAAVARYLPDSNPSKPVTLRLDRVLGKDANVFSYGGWTGVMMFAEAIRRGAATRSAINGELERMVFVGPEGIHRFSKLKHAGLSSRSLVTSTIRNCKLVPLPGQDLGG